LELGIDARGQKRSCDGLPEGQKSLKIVLVI